ncbi:MAG: hypothetical protein WCM93_09920, partial [Bacteroidota bacterium]
MKELHFLLNKGNYNQAVCLAVSICLLVSIISPARADSTITSGTNVRVSAGTTLVNIGSLTIKSGGAISNLGTVNVSGNLDNQNVSSTDLGVGTFLLNGAALQNVNGKNTFGNLTISNSSGVSLNGNTIVNGVLSLTNGRVTLGANNLLLGTSASVAGSPSSSSMVVATGAGEFRKSFSAAGSFTYPVGDNTGTAEYTPVTLVFTGGSYGSGNYAGVNLVNAQYPGSPATGSFLNRYWGVTQSGITGFSCSATFQYLLADVSGTESQIYCVRLLPTSVAYFSAANLGLHQLSATGLTALGTFTGSQTRADKNLNLTVFLEGLYNGGGTMRKAQNDVGNQFPGTTADQITVELHNASSYSTIVYSPVNVNLSTTGTATAIIPGIHSGSYYVTIKHRNSLSTSTALPLSFASGPVAYNFDAPAKAYGSNMLMMSDGRWVIFGGDVNQDFIVDGGDMSIVENDAANAVSGYLPDDCNGDGLIDGGDM